MLIKKIFYFYSKKHRERRAKLFLNLLNPTPKDKILDLGSGDGSYIANILPFRENVYLADISEKDLKKAQKKYGFKNTILLKEDDPILPFPDKYFDIVFLLFCN
ncbi:MAG TPA: methyltransferase domain-containing protein [Candidatus Desulfofervidus auxilii]|uniref:Methyltransferase domain-containing protein n=1 Tax=Desulfofervidus auxilii TaxID=1621989 RepID=A0A7C0Y3Q2_DESA2|nr:methyltransferase domain-containing protein [Candidatus Desulfofervidus auxilii]